MNKPKFNIDDIVEYRNEYSFNPAHRVRSVGKIEAIHIYYGVEIGYYPSRGETEPKSLAGRISYTVTGSSILIEEDELTLYGLKGAER